MERNLTRWAAGIACLLLADPAWAVCAGADLPAWATRDGSGDLVVNRSLGADPITFEEEVSCMGVSPNTGDAIAGWESWGLNILAPGTRAVGGNPSGFSIPDVNENVDDDEDCDPQTFEFCCDPDTVGKHSIVYEHVLDPYDGKPLGQGYCTVDTPEPEWHANDCNPTGNDNARVPWGGCYGEVLVKNVSWLNAIRKGGAHADINQACNSLHPSVASGRPGWVVIQGSEWTNSDDHPTNFKCFIQQEYGIAFHDVRFGQDAAFDLDCDIRKGTTADEGNCGNNAIIRPGHHDIPALWLVSIKNDTNDSIIVGNCDGTGGCAQGGKFLRIITIGSDEGVEWDAETSSVSNVVVEYDSIEDAVTGGETLFPYAHLQCAGWETPPAGCIAYRGAVSNDIDQDGVLNDADTCSTFANSGQDDCNSDGYGDLCDPDFDDSGTVGIPDFNLLLANLLKSGDECDGPCDCTQGDMTGDGAIGIPDFNAFRNHCNPPGSCGVGSLPGPSGPNR